MTISEAVAQGIYRIRRPNWTSPAAYLRLSVVEMFGVKVLGPAFRFYDRPTQQAIGVETPQVFPWTGDKANDWKAYTGAPDAEDVES